MGCPLAARLDVLCSWPKFLDVHILQEPGFLSSLAASVHTQHSRGCLLSATGIPKPLAGERGRQPMGSGLSVLLHLGHLIPVWLGIHCLLSQNRALPELLASQRESHSPAWAPAVPQPLFSLSVTKVERTAFLSPGGSMRGGLDGGSRLY